ncbi:MAG: hypothetical protein PHS60_11265 [Zavarzinia sp.]|nr:hypothetical protein [Zavarzinia sp.]
MDDDFANRGRNGTPAPREPGVRYDAGTGRIHLPPALAAWFRPAAPRHHESLCANVARTLCEWGAPANAVADRLQRTLDAKEGAAPRGITVDALL